MNSKVPVHIVNQRLIITDSLCQLVTGVTYAGCVTFYAMHVTSC
jgi:hypothetical protein